MAVRSSERPVCKLIGTNGDSAAIIKRVVSTLRSVGHADLIDEYVDRATRGTYLDLLNITSEYVRIS